MALAADEAAALVLLPLRLTVLVVKLLLLVDTAEPAGTPVLAAPVPVEVAETELVPLAGPEVTDPVYVEEDVEFPMASVKLADWARNAPVNIDSALKVKLAP